MSTLRKLDCFTVMSSSCLDMDEINVLSLLYQPLIGVNGYTIYMILNSFVNSNKAVSGKYTHNIITKTTQLSLQEFLNSRHKLEAIGLLDVYVDDGEYYYILKKPYTAKQFIKDGFLGVYLHSKIGEKQFSELVEMFKVEKISLKNKQNITKSFDEVFESVRANVDVEFELKDKILNNDIKLYNREFDYELFVNGLSKNFVDKRKLTEKFKNTIIRLAYVYNINELDMQQVYTRSVNTNRDIDYDKLSINAQREFQFKNQKKSHKPVSSEKEEENIFKKYTPMELLKHIGNGHAAAGDLKIVDQIIVSSNFKIEVINLMLKYVLDMNENRMPSFNYFEKIISEWHRNSISTYEEAYDYLLKKHSQKEKKQQRKTVAKKQNNGPDINPSWLEEYEKEMGFKK